jgi:hypothetical protein
MDAGQMQTLIDRINQQLAAEGEELRVENHPAGRRDFGVGGCGCSR